MHPVQKAIETIAHEVHELKSAVGNADNPPQSEIGVVPFSMIEFANGYPFSKKEIPFKKPFADDKVMVRLMPVFSAITNSQYAMNVYEVTNTGFKLRINVKDVANKGLLKELYYEAIYIGASSND